MSKFYCDVCKSEYPCSTQNWGIECEVEIEYKNLKVMTEIIRYNADVVSQAVKKKVKSTFKKLRYLSSVEYFRERVKKLNKDSEDYDLDRSYWTDCYNYLIYSVGSTYLQLTSVLYNMGYRPSLTDHRKFIKGEFIVETEGKDNTDIVQQIISNAVKEKVLLK